MLRCHASGCRRETSTHCERRRQARQRQHSHRRLTDQRSFSLSLSLATSVMFFRCVGGDWPAATLRCVVSLSMTRSTTTVPRCACTTMRCSRRRRRRGGKSRSSAVRPRSTGAAKEFCMGAMILTFMFRKCSGIVPLSSGNVPGSALLELFLEPGTGLFRN